MGEHDSCRVITFEYIYIYKLLIKIRLFRKGGIFKKFFILRYVGREQSTGTRVIFKTLLYILYSIRGVL